MFVLTKIVNNSDIHNYQQKKSGQSYDVRSQTKGIYYLLYAFITEIRSRTLFE